MLRSTSLAVAVAGLLAQGACGLYADQAGKLDWHRQNLGRFVSASFDGRGGLTVVGEVRGHCEGGGLVDWVLGWWVIGLPACPHHTPARSQDGEWLNRDFAAVIYSSRGRRFSRRHTSSWSVHGGTRPRAEGPPKRTIR